MEGELSAIVHVVPTRTPVTGFPSLAASARSKFYVREPLHAKPDWLKVGLTLGATAFLWGYVSPLRRRGGTGRATSPSGRIAAYLPGTYPPGGKCEG